MQHKILQCTPRSPISRESLTHLFLNFKIPRIMESNSPESFGVRVRGSGVKCPTRARTSADMQGTRDAEPQSPYEMA